jgi:hypothetical protein
MSYPSGAPGGYQPQQPNPGGPQGGPYGPQPRQGGGFALTPVRIVYLITAGLGLVSLFVGFADTSGTTCTYGGCAGSDSFYSGGIGWIPGLLAIGGLLALLPVLPGRNREFGWSGVIAAVNVGAVLAILFSFFSSGNLGAGSVMIMIFAILQLAAAVLAYLWDAGVLPMPSGGGGYRQPGGQYPGSGPFPPPPGGQQPQPGGYYNQQGQYPPSGQQPAQPGPQGQPPAKPTQFMQHPGQLSQPGPGTPPGGYNNQG